MLHSDGFKGKNGIQSSLIQAPKGMGKSTVLKSFKKVCPILFPKIIPIYISYDAMRAEGSKLSEHCIANLIKWELEKQGISILPGDDILVDRISAALVASNRYVVLIVDEIDQLYKVTRTDKEVCKIAHTSLYDLAALGNQCDGRFGVFLCGSSASCPLLVTCNVNVSREEFPLLDGAPDLNDQKYRTRRLPPSVCTDVPMVKEVLHSLNIPCDTSLARYMTFLAGCVPRTLDDMAVSIQRQNTEVYRSLRGFSHESSVDINKQQLTTRLYECIIDKLAERNKAVKDMISLKNGTICLDKIANTPWETVFEPLDQERVFDAWYQVCENYYGHDIEACKKMRENNSELQRSLFMLCDKGLLNFDVIERSLPRNIYPVAPAQVFIDRLEARQLLTLTYKIDDMLVSFFSQLKSEGIKQGATKIIEIMEE